MKFVKDKIQILNDHEVPDFRHYIYNIMLTQEVQGTY